jgi:uncharacterized protein (TIGR03083 family)
MRLPATAPLDPSHPTTQEKRHGVPDRVLPQPDLPNLVAALWKEREELLAFTQSLRDAEWFASSAAAGWRIADVVAHIGATARSFYTPTGLGSMRAPSLEKLNEAPVERRRDWPRARVIAEYERTSRRAANLLSAVSRTPAARVRVPLAELGRFPLGLMIGGALVFDHHTHLRHDIAPALGRKAPATDADRMRAVLTWMTAVLSNQVANQPVHGLAGGVDLILTGPGGGTWRISEHGAIPASDGGAAATVVASAASFPDWGTQRSSWRDHDLSVAGDADLAERFLDSVNVI